MRYLYYLTFLVFLTSGCGDGLETSTNDESVNITNSLLVGTWSSKCNETVISSSSAKTSKTSLIFSSTGDNLTATEIYYSDSNCSNQNFIFKKVFDNLVFVSKTLTDQNQIINKFTTKIVSITLEPKTSYVSSTLNYNRYCGLSGWSPDNQTSISGLTCESTTYKSTNDVHRDIIQISSEKSFIRLGNIKNTDNTTGFPKSLYAEEYFK